MSVSRTPRPVLSQHSSYSTPDRPAMKSPVRAVGIPALRHPKPSLKPSGMLLNGIKKSAEALTPIKPTNAVADSSLLSFIRNQRAPRLGVKRGGKQAPPKPPAAQKPRAPKRPPDLPARGAPKRAKVAASPPVSPEGSAGDEEASPKAKGHKKNNDSSWIKAPNPPWFPEEKRAMRRAHFHRPDLAPLPPDRFWEEVAKIVNNLALGRKKAKQSPKRPDDCRAQWETMESESHQAMKPLPKAKAKAKKKETRTITQRLKGSTKQWELDKIIAERSFKPVKATDKTLFANQSPLRPSLPPSVFANQSPLRPCLPISVFTPGASRLFRSPHTGTSTMARASVDWDVLDQKIEDVVEVATLQGQTPDRASCSQEAYAAVDGAMDLQIKRGTQHFQKAYKACSVKPSQLVRKPRAVIGGEEGISRAMLEKKEIKAGLRKELGEFHHIMGRVESEGECAKKEALIFAEDLLERALNAGVMDIGQDLQLLYEAGDLSDYVKYINDLEAVCEAED